MQCESATANSTVLRSAYSYPLDCFQSEKGISAMNLSQIFIAVRSDGERRAIVENRRLSKRG